jgi:hypothetical protein
MDEYNAAAIILCGIPLDKPFPQHYLTILEKVEKNKLRKEKLYLEDCFYMRGTVYPTRPFKTIKSALFKPYFETTIIHHVNQKTLHLNQGQGSCSINSVIYPHTRGSIHPKWMKS